MPNHTERFKHLDLLQPRAGRAKSRCAVLIGGLSDARAFDHCLLSIQSGGDIFYVETMLLGDDGFKDVSLMTFTTIQRAEDYVHSHMVSCIQKGQHIVRGKGTMCPAIGSLISGSRQQQVKSAAKTARQHVEAIWKDVSGQGWLECYA